MIRALKRVIGVPRRSDVLYECRRCGTSVPEETTDCPECENGDVVRYEL